MAEWTAERRAKMYELIGEADLAGLRKLAHEHPHLRPSDLRPIDKRSFKSFQARTADDVLIQTALLDMLEDRQGSLSLIASHTFRALKDFPDDLFIARFEALADEIIGRHQKLVEEARHSWPAAFRPLLEMAPRVHSYYLLDMDELSKISWYVIAVCNAPSRAKAESVLKYVRSYRGNQRPPISNRLLFGAGQRAKKLHAWLESFPDRESAGPSPLSETSLERVIQRTWLEPRAAAPRATLPELLKEGSLHEIFAFAQKNPRLAFKQLGLEKFEDALTALAARVATDEGSRGLLLEALLGPAETGHLLATAILKHVPAFELETYRDPCFSAVPKTFEVGMWHDWAEAKKTRRRYTVLFEHSLGSEPAITIGWWLNQFSTHEFWRLPPLASLAAALINKLGLTEAGSLIEANLHAERSKASAHSSHRAVGRKLSDFEVSTDGPLEYLMKLASAPCPTQSRPARLFTWENVNGAFHAERALRDPHFAITTRHYYGRRPQEAPEEMVLDLAKMGSLPGSPRRAFFLRHEKAIRSSSTVEDLHRASPSFFPEIFRSDVQGQENWYIWLYDLAESLCDRPEFSAIIANYIARCMEAASRDMDWAFRFAFEDPRRLFRSGRTLFDLVKAGLWTLNQSVARDSIRRVQALVHAGACTPDEAFDAIEEVFATESPALWSAAAKGLGELKLVHPGLQLKKPGRIRELIARDPKKYARTFKGLIENESPAAGKPPRRARKSTARG